MIFIYYLFINTNKKTLTESFGRVRVKVALGQEEKLDDKLRIEIPRIDLVQNQLISERETHFENI